MCTATTAATGGGTMRFVLSVVTALSVVMLACSPTAPSPTAIPPSQAPKPAAPAPEKASTAPAPDKAAAAASGKDSQFQQLVKQAEAEMARTGGKVAYAT